MSNDVCVKMADKTCEEKTLETIKLNCLPSYPGAISWSLDDRIAVITDQCVYILTLGLSPVKFGVNVEKTSIGCKKPVVLDVGIDKKKITDAESLHWRLDPNVNPSLLSCACFHKVAWSPLNCDISGRCVIAALFTEYQLSIYVSPTFGTKWKEAINISQVLHSYLTQNSFELGQDVMQEATQKNSVKDGTIKGVSISSEYSLFKQRTQILSFTCLHWFSQLYHTEGTLSSHDNDKTSENKRFAVFVTGTQSGALVFWKVTIPVIMNSAEIQLDGFLNTQQSWPCSLSWKGITGNQGLLAVGGTDGLVKIFALKVLPSISGIAQYVVWGDKDDVQVHWLDWLHTSQTQNGLHHLVVCKGPSVIIFSTSVKDGMLTQKPHHKIIQGVHRMPITGLACTHSGTVFTCSLDGTVQTSTADGAPATAVNYDAKKGFMCSGIGVSSNAVFLALFLSPSNYTQQSLESHQIHIRFVNMAWGSSSIASVLNSKDVQLERRWDVCKAVQHFIYYSKQLPAVQLLTHTDTDVLQTFSFAELIIRHYVLSAMLIIARQQEGELVGNESLLMDMSVQLDCTVDLMYKRLVTTKLMSWLEARQAGTVNHADSVSALIMSDWLVLNGSVDSAAQELVTKVYKACSDTQGLNKVMSPQGQTTTPTDTQHQSSAAVDISSVCENGCTSLPAREACPICEAGITVESLNYGTCPNGHKWPRCFVSFCVCAEITHKQCQDCNRSVSSPSARSSPWLRGLLQLTSKCPFCFGFFC